jgi:hypothetical protein
MKVSRKGQHAQHEEVVMYVPPQHTSVLIQKGKLWPAAVLAELSLKFLMYTESPGSGTKNGFKMILYVLSKLRILILNQHKINTSRSTMRTMVTAKNRLHLALLSSSFCRLCEACELEGKPPRGQKQL